MLEPIVLTIIKLIYIYVPQIPYYHSNKRTLHKRRRKVKFAEENNILRHYKCKLAFIIICQFFFFMYGPHNLNNGVKHCTAIYRTRCAEQCTLN